MPSRPAAAWPPTAAAAKTEKAVGASSAPLVPWRALSEIGQAAEEPVLWGAGVQENLSYGLLDRAGRWS